ncbi:hypothetical protein Tco_1016749 [Tanacetum coccineum]|uniref:Uncharacterized protein n=1 Tax=Tanacetum coccineum TaxID=301880 RepID=A0ABQ5FQK5_9ASTR
MTSKEAFTHREWPGRHITLAQSSSHSSRISLLLIILLMAEVILVGVPTTVPTLEVLPLPFVPFNFPLILCLQILLYQLVCHMHSFTQVGRLGRSNLALDVLRQSSDVSIHFYIFWINHSWTHQGQLIESLGISNNVKLLNLQVPQLVLHPLNFFCWAKLCSH